MPRRFRAVVEEMDRTGNISAAFATMQRLTAQAVAEKVRRVSLPKQVEIGIAR